MQGTLIIQLPYLSMAIQKVKADMQADESPIKGYLTKRKQNQKTNRGFKPNNPDRDLFATALVTLSTIVRSPAETDSASQQHPLKKAIHLDK